MPSPERLQRPCIAWKIGADSFKTWILRIPNPHNLTHNLRFGVGYVWGIPPRSPEYFVLIIWCWFSTYYSTPSEQLRVSDVDTAAYSWFMIRLWFLRICFCAGCSQMGWPPKCFQLHLHQYHIAGMARGRIGGSGHQVLAADGPWWQNSWEHCPHLQGNLNENRVDMIPDTVDRANLLCKQHFIGWKSP